MAMVNCPKCKKIVSNTSKKCPNCGAAFTSGLSNNNNPAGKKLKLISTIIMYISSLLLFIDIFNIAKTYVGGMLLGCGFVLHGYAQAKMEKAEGFDGKSKTKATMAIGVVLFIVGILFLYLDLTLPQ